MSDLVGNPEDRFSRVAAHNNYVIMIIFGVTSVISEPKLNHYQ